MKTKRLESIEINASSNEAWCPLIAHNVNEWGLWIFLDGDTNNFLAMYQEGNGKENLEWIKLMVRSFSPHRLKRIIELIDKIKEERLKDERK